VNEAAAAKTVGVGMVGTDVYIQGKVGWSWLTDTFYRVPALRKSSNR
jgi:hypothetical protein